MSADEDGCALCAGDCTCESDYAGVSDEERRQIERDRERARELFRAAGRPVPAWLSR